MHITSIDKKASLQLSRNSKEFHSPFSVECSVDIGHGKFHALNNDIHFLNAQDFVKDLDSFILNREIIPQLTGTYDTSVRFSQPNLKNIMMVNFTIGDAYCGYSATVRFKTEGEFEVDAEFLNNYLEAFRAIFKNT